MRGLVGNLLEAGVGGRAGSDTVLGEVMRLGAHDQVGQPEAGGVVDQRGHIRGDARAGRGGASADGWDGGVGLGGVPGGFVPQLEEHLQVVRAGEGEQPVNCRPAKVPGGCVRKSVQKLFKGERAMVLKRYITITPQRRDQYHGEPPRVWCILPFKGRIDHAQEIEQEDKEEVIRGVLEHSHKYPSKWAAITIVAERLGMSPESLSSCIRQYQL